MAPYLGFACFMLGFMFLTALACWHVERERSRHHASNETLLRAMLAQATSELNSFEIQFSRAEREVIAAAIRMHELERAWHQNTGSARAWSAAKMACSAAVHHLICLRDGCADTPVAALQADVSEDSATPRRSYLPEELRIKPNPRAANG